ncbi:hypothetical protein EON83_21355 [bacterium]|nr:MAG: hypothetical protein EON83_21355 [bacterium]
MSRQLEQYLNQLRLQLKALPTDQREAEVEEAHQHLLALIEHRVGQGETHEAAVSAAIQQFGTPQANGKALRKAWRRGEPSRERLISVLHSLVAAGVIFHLLVGIFPFPPGVFNYYPYYIHYPYSLLTSMFQAYNFDTAWGCLAQLALSLFAAASLSAPQKYRALFLALLTSLSLFKVATVLPPGKVLSPLAVSYYLATQMLSFALSSWALWLIVKQGKTPVRTR